MCEKKYEFMQDTEIIQCIRQGEKDATDYLLHKYRGLVKREVRTLYLIGADSEDLLQEGMIGLFKAMRDFDEAKGVPFLAFAKLCIQRQMYSAVAASGRKKHAPLNGYVSFDAPLGEQEGEGTLMDVLDSKEAIHNPEQLAMEKERMEQLVNDADKNLSPLERKIFTLYLDGNTYDEIGSALHKDKKAIDNGVQRIKKKLFPKY